MYELKLVSTAFYSDFIFFFIKMKLYKCECGTN